MTHFVEAPAGAFFVGRTFLLCAPSRKRLVVAHVASLDATEVPMVDHLLALPSSAGLDERYDILYDVGAVETMDHTSFVLFEEFVRKTIDHLVSRTNQFAMVRPVGLAGHLFSGMFHDWLVPHLQGRIEMFTSRDAALEWLDFPGPERDAVEHELDLFTHTTPLLRQLRELLALEPRSPSLSVIAGKLHISARSLQRSLGDIGTTFRNEVTRARVRVAQAMLVSTDEKIESIARVVGFRSAAAFTTMFRAEVGQPPTTFRARHRGDGA
ncbi:MAG: helix-turn-helix domain-containing protein [Kofleriaceae bacterium]